VTPEVKSAKDETRTTNQIRRTNDRSSKLEQGRPEFVQPPRYSAVRRRNPPVCLGYVPRFLSSAGPPWGRGAGE